MFATDGWRPAVNLGLASISSVLYAGFIWFAVRKSMQAAYTRPTHDLSVLVGQIGEAKTRIQAEGTVQVAGELWSARSEKSIPDGSPVKVIGREGFVLVVEKSTDTR
jgi:membrane-bound ClpP family serine protease